MQWYPAPTDQELLEGNAADRRQASRNPIRRFRQWSSDLGDRREDWLFRQLTSHPEYSFYWLGFVCFVYLLFQARDLLEPGPGRWVTVAIFAPMLLAVPIMAFFTGKLARLTHLMDERRRKEQQAGEIERQQREVSEQLDDLEAKLKAQRAARTIEANHDTLDCPGPSTRRTSLPNAQGDLIEHSWVCPTCELRWVHRGIWIAP